MEKNLQRDVLIIDEIIRDLARTFAMQDVEETLDISINFSYLSVLCQIHILGKPTMGELGQVSDVQLSTLTRVIDKLVRWGFVCRTTEPSDRRVVRVILSEEGIKMVEKFEAARKKRVISILKCLTPQERENLVEILQVIYNRVFKEKKEKIEK